MGISMKVLLFLMVCSIGCFAGSTTTSNSGPESNFYSNYTAIIRQNQTGHEVVEFSYKDDAIKGDYIDMLRILIEHKTTTKNGVGVYHTKSLYSVPVNKPTDYELFPGVGYYKFHPELANGFEDASSICAKGGGNLAIVNSEAEHQVMAKLFARYPKSKLNASWAFVGFHDREKEGEYVTIFGQPLNTTGFTRWTPNNPDNQDGEENCGAVDRNGSLNDVGCSLKLPFICEFDILWPLDLAMIKN